MSELLLETMVPLWRRVKDTNNTKESVLFTNPKCPFSSFFEVVYP
jgi:hypothetical protein